MIVAMKTRKLKCNFNSITRKQLVKKHKLPSTFDLFNIKYTEPQTKDLAVGLVYFNSAKSKRLLMNYLYILEKFKMANIPTYTIEMYEDTPEIKDAIHVKTDFILFQKERLCYILEKHIPETYTKLLFIDTDLVFDNINWYTDLSKKLNTVNIVQPFNYCIWLDLTYRKIIKQRIPIVFYKKYRKLRRKGEIGGFHPGFAWAFQRSWYRKIGTFQYAILGDGDTVNSCVWLDYSFTPIEFLTKSIEDYKNSIKEEPSICFIDTTLYHLWHGDLNKRQYSERRNIFKSVKDIRDILTVDSNGLFALKDSAASLKPRIRKYFKNRDDDSVENSST